MGVFVEKNYAYPKVLNQQEQLIGWGHLFCHLRYLLLTYLIQLILWYLTAPQNNKTYLPFQRNFARHVIKELCEFMCRSSSKIYIFPAYFAKRKLISHFLCKYSKALAKITCGVIWGWEMSTWRTEPVIIFQRAIIFATLRSIWL